jgi:hypothetical protein
VTQPASQFVARIMPGLPQGCPKNITLSMLDGLGRKQYVEEQGFVPVEAAVVPVLKRVHMDGLLTEQGGKGAKLFEVVTEEEAMQIVAEEEQRMLLGRSGAGALQHAQLRAAALKKQALAEQAAEAKALASRGQDQEGPQPSTTAAPPDAPPEGAKPTARLGKARGPRVPR